MDVNYKAASPASDAGPGSSMAFVRLVLLAGGAMSVGWGFRGNYGHEAGAMIPGALLGLALAIGSGNAAWHRRGLLLAFLGALGWAFGGQMSYGRIIGYICHSSYPDVAYGFASLFVIGGLWGGIGAGILALALTEKRSSLSLYTGPLLVLWLCWLLLDLSGATRWLQSRWSFHDSDWIAASSALLIFGFYFVAVPAARPACGLLLHLACGWLLGLTILTGLLGLRMTPPRGDNWAGCVGLFLGLVCWLWRRENRAALFLVRYGFIAGGIGFATAALFQVLGRAQWGPIGRYDVLHGLDYWKWMEQGFGLIMGVGVALGAVRLLQDNLQVGADDVPTPLLDNMAAFFLLLVMPWMNLHKNLRDWRKSSLLPEDLFAVSPDYWLLVVGLLFAAIVLLGHFQHWRGRLDLLPAGLLARWQLLFLVILVTALGGDFTRAITGLGHRGVFLVQLSFWLTGLLCAALVLTAPSARERASPTNSPDAGCWKPGWRLVIATLAVALLIPFLAWAAVGSHEAPLPQSHLRFEEAATP